MKPVYPAAKEALLRGQMDLLIDQFAMALVSNYTYDATDATLDDLDVATLIVGEPVLITITSVDGGVAIVNDVTFPDVTGPDPIIGLLTVHTSGALLCYVDQRADTVPLGIVPNGADITFSFDYLVKI